MIYTNPALAKPFTVASKNNTVRYNLTQFVCNTENDIAVVPTTVAPGSTLFCIESSNTYMLNTTREWVKISANNGIGDYFEIKLDFNTMTCNYSASEIRQAFNDDKPFIGNFVYDATNLTDEENNVATIAHWDATCGNKVWKYTVLEDKTVDVYEHTFRLLKNDPECITVSSSNTIGSSKTANRLADMIVSNNNILPIIYLVKDSYVYNLVFYQLDDAGTGNLFRFACVTDTAIKFAEISGESKEVTFTENLFS